MNKRNICVLGGTGFVGGHIVNHLAREGHHIRVLTRRRERHRELLVLPTVQVIEADIHDVHELKDNFLGCDAVINLVGILNESKAQSFQSIHEELPRKVIQACQGRGISRLLHMSALNADAINGASKYLRSKGVGEDFAHNTGDMAVTSFRPSVIFGHDDHFFNRFADLLKLSPVFFPLACPDALFAPVHVDDVATAFTRALNNKATYGQRYDMCGPRPYTLKELVQYTMDETDYKRIIIDLDKGLAYLQARILELVPGKPLSRDNLDSMQVDSICQGTFPEIFGITPSSVEAIVPGYIGAREAQKQDHYHRYRRHAGRDE